jgi:hypothetical protein
MTLERLAFMTVLVISRMIDSIRLEITDSRMGSKVSTWVGPPPSQSQTTEVFLVGLPLDAAAQNAPQSGWRKVANGSRAFAARMSIGSGQNCIALSRTILW